MHLTKDRFFEKKEMRRFYRETRKEAEKCIYADCDHKFILDYYIFAVAAYTGLRISELSNLKWKHIRKDYLVVKEGKGGKKRTIIFGNRLQAIFDELKELQDEEYLRSEENFLFVGQRGPYSRFGIHRRFEYWRERLELSPELTMHSIRHTYATKLLDKGINIKSVQHQLGHSSIAVTSVYLHFTEDAEEKLRRVL